MIVVKEFPRATELNSILFDRVYENLSGGGRYGENFDAGPGMTDWDLHNKNIKEIDELTSWISRVLPNVSKNFVASKTKPRLGLHSYEDEKGYDFNVNGFEISACWGVHYKGDQGLNEHNHFPAILAFGYYVRTPSGSAPIIIEGETHNVKEGQCIFFLASAYHSVEKKLEGDERCAIIGNIIYNDYIHFGG
jgi:hypothetical protein